MVARKVGSGAAAAQRTEGVTAGDAAGTVAGTAIQSPAMDEGEAAGVKQRNSSKSKKASQS